MQLQTLEALVGRLEATAGLVASEQARADADRIGALAEQLNSPVKDLEKKIEQSLEQYKKIEKQLKGLLQSQAANTAKELTAQADTTGAVPFIAANLGSVDGNFAQAVADALKGKFEGVVVLGAAGNESVALVASVPDSLTNKVQAGRIIQSIAPIVGGKGGGKPTKARGGGKDANKLDEALAEVPKILAS